MPVTYYKCAPFDHSQENRAFEYLCVTAAEHLADLGDVYIIGNISPRIWPPIDTLVITPRSIVIIDFKDYGGEIRITEENYWMTTEDVRVPGGKKYDNPYQQVASYKSWLIKALSDHKLLHHSNNLSHIGGIVIFTKKVVLDNKLDPRSRTWFHVGDFKSAIYFLRHRTSQELYVPVSFMENLVARLGAKPFELRIIDESKDDTIRQAEKDEKPRENSNLDAGNIFRHTSTLTRLRLVMFSVASVAAVIAGYFGWQYSGRNNPVGVMPLAKSTLESAVGKYITASQALDYVGSTKTVCGEIAALREIPSGLFINIDNAYPNEIFSAIIWRDQLHNISTSSLKEKHRLCISGYIKNYRGKAEIEISNPEQIVSP